jgi:D-alanyl-lipoteichoic acid acyltransferase DltB (MBOAT superfamily)
MVFFIAILLQASCLILLKYMESGLGGFRMSFRDEGYKTDMVLVVAGFSVYTLQHIAYLAAIYRGRIQAGTQLFRFLLFSSFFAKFNSGPFEEPENLIGQFNSPVIQQDSIVQGVQRIVLGLFKKMVLADRLAPVVAEVFSGRSQQGSFTVATGVCLFTIQLYFDFSAYSDIAIGAAKLFGIELTENFNRPLLSRSISEFWRKWHISLYRLFSTYVYFPIVYFFRENGKLAVLTGIAATFLASGIWHGIGQTFLIWSLLHALYLSLEYLRPKTRISWTRFVPANVHRIFSIGMTFALVCFSNLFFRSADMTQARLLLTQLVSSPFGGKGVMNGYFSALAGGGYEEALFNLFVTVFFVLAFLFLERGIHERIQKSGNGFVQIFIMLIAIFTFGVFKSAGYFIYVQF